MNIRLLRLASGMLVFAAVVLMAGRSWAVYHQLAPSKDEWGLKYDVELTAADRDTVNVVFTLADEGRLKPIYSITVVAFSAPDSQGGRSYDVKAPIELKATKDGKRAGQVQIPKKFADGAMIRILTLTVNGQRQTAGAAYYDIPLKKYLNKAPAAGGSISRPTKHLRLKNVAQGQSKRVPRASAQPWVTPPTNPSPSVLAATSSRTGSAIRSS